MIRMQPTTFWRARTFTKKSLPRYFELLDLEIEAQTAIFNWNLYQIEERRAKGLDDLSGSHKSQVEREDQIT